MPDDESDFDTGKSTEEMDDTGASALWQVYFLSLADPSDPDHSFDLVKVGITKNDVDRRIEQLQTGEQAPCPHRSGERALESNTIPSS